MASYEGQTTQWPKDEGQTTQWPKEKDQKDKHGNGYFLFT
jgi:hypothetical protein